MDADQGMVIHIGCVYMNRTRGVHVNLLDIPLIFLLFNRVNFHLAVFRHLVYLIGIDSIKYSLIVYILGSCSF